MSQRHALRTERLYNKRPVEPFILAEHLDDMPAKVTINLDALHAEALRMDHEITLLAWEQELETEREAWAWLERDDEQRRIEREEEAEQARIDAEFHGYGFDHWIYFTPDMEEVRDIFGGSDFIIIHTFRSAR